VIAGGLGVLWARQYPRLAFEEKAFLVGCVYAIGATSAVMIATRGAETVAVDGEWAHRYGYGQRIFFVMLASVLIGRAAMRLPVPVRASALVALALGVAVMNARNRQYYDIHDSAEAERVAAFIRELDERRASARAGERIQASLDRGRWTIEIDTGADSGPADSTR
jgi:hypothetical protein